MINFDSFGDLSSLDLGDFAPKPTSFTDGQVEAAKQLWASEDGASKVGVWECTPGRFSADRTQSSEICHILSGTATVVSSQGGDERQIGPGDLLVLPLGWQGEWTIHQKLRKTYVITQRA
ncbi:cupin domain-containing protein [Hoeflea sp. YIM 152468]|uniref:cupin domain-containing protein n=1 Tax=Hoeflea sp. YIM 152468 TaxID=3031759 RepID=UPI0023DC549A|nr:cupin domain-containing protein [Hoeflea sp. YIM 152468]MDF1608537.1 cupin domain-containing protein [Hoeflea sp. YIM 152468]